MLEEARDRFLSTLELDSEDVAAHYSLSLVYEALGDKEKSQQHRALHARYPAMERIAVEPAESAVLSGRPAGTHRIEGGGAGFRPPLLGDDDLDGVLAVSTADAFAMARRACREEGLFSGASTGANVVAALDTARRLGPGHRVVTVQVDSGLKYLAGPVFSG